MRLLVIGGGGREHAVVWALCKSLHVLEIWCTPGNAGIAVERLWNGKFVHMLDIAATDLSGILKIAQEIKADLVVVCPDDPLALGLVDLLEQNGIAAFGPRRNAAMFESSKVWAHNFMKRWNIPSPEGEVFTEMGPAKDYAKSLHGFCAVKNDELSLGKGVDVCDDVEQAFASIERKFTEKPGRTLLIQEREVGEEASFHVISSGKDFRVFPASLDHKQIGEGNRGPMTGGMGTNLPNPFVDEGIMDRFHSEIVARWQLGCVSEGIDYRGVLYPGAMLTRRGPVVLEFNARFGDPETQVYLMRLENDLLKLLHACATGAEHIPDLKWSEEFAASVCIVLATRGYPVSKSSSQIIFGLENADKYVDVKVFHAGTAMSSGGVTMTNGGRVLGVTSRARDLMTARERALEVAELIKWDGKQMRRDIALKAIEYLALKRSQIP